MFMRKAKYSSVAAVTRLYNRALVPRKGGIFFHSRGRPGSGGHAARRPVDTVGFLGGQALESEGVCLP
jgi:hypothetical protein